MARAGITANERSIIDGQAFTSSFLNAALVTATSAEVLIQTPATGTITLRATGRAAGISQLLLFEGPTFSVAGAALTEVNHNRVGTPLVTTCIVTSGPTTSADGTLLHDDFIVAAGSGSFTGKDGIILEQDTDYLLRLTNLSGGNVHASIVVEFSDSNL